MNLNKLIEELGQDRVVEVNAVDGLHCLNEDVEEPLWEAILRARQSGEEQFILIRVQP